MKKCQNCSNDNSLETNFCIYCGNSFIMQCSPCDFSNGFCVECGKKEISFSLTQTVDEKLACISDIGRRHKTNQDYAGVKTFSDGTTLLVVADGVSTAFNSEEAAKLAVSTVMQYVEGKPTTTETLAQAIYAAHDKIIKMTYQEIPELVEPMCTIVVTAVKDNKVFVSWVGDSRAYVFSDKKAQLLTTDDSWVSDAVKHGLSEEEALKSIHSHEITQCLGTRDEEPLANVLEHVVKPGDTIMLCSDGLWNYFKNPQDMQKYVSHDMQETCKKFVLYANSSGGHDNISVACFLVNSQ
ncbi:MAG: serine/threonine-protein phosphatase [Candidatus Sericytochromatia bacterium]|nr:serine/threonine-protein phosphatase [Candidatus Sericytochromatia bacterium]